jgi:carboxymethylenebutenolidase
MKLLRRLALWTGGVLVILAVVLLGSVAVDGWLGGGRLEAVTNLRVASAAGPEVRAYVARPASPGPHPAVIMIHEFWGLNADIVGKAEALAEAGYVVIAPDMFRGRTTSWVPSAIYQVVSTPQEQLVADLDAVYAWLEAQPDVQAERVGIMGFCFGGRTSLIYSLANTRLAATAILYGSLITKADQLRALPGPVLGIFGGADQSISVAEVRAFEAALNEAGVPNQITIYEGQPHAFVRSIGEIRQDGVQGQAWEQVVTFFDENLKGASTLRRPDPAAGAVPGLDWGYLLRLAYEHAFGTPAHLH